ncbi:hypothetical protein [Streptomyces sp. NPDC003719]
MDRNVSGGSGERLLDELVRAARLTSRAELPGVLNRYTQAMGLGRAVIYLIDVQQRLLVPFVEGEPELDLDTSLAGWAYHTNSLRVEEVPLRRAEHVVGTLADGAERLGVVELNMSTLDGLKLRRCRTAALLLALIITSKRTYSDTIAQRLRTRPMHLHLEPAYELDGDAFDHAFTEDVLHAAVLDGMGYELASGLATSVARAGCRNARRSGADLNELVGTTGEAVDRSRAKRPGSAAPAHPCHPRASAQRTQRRRHDLDVRVAAP